MTNRQILKVGRGGWGLTRLGGPGKEDDIKLKNTMLMNATLLRVVQIALKACFAKKT